MADAYAFNPDRSKVPVYTKEEIDQMDLVNDQALQQEVADRQTAVSEEASTRAAADSLLGIRISNIVASAGDGTIPSELVDLRLSYDGYIYATAGDACRIIEEDLKRLAFDNMSLVKHRTIDDVDCLLWKLGGNSEIHNDSSPNIARFIFKVDDPSIVVVSTDEDYEVQIASCLTLLSAAAPGVYPSFVNCSKPDAAWGSIGNGPTLAIVPPGYLTVSVRKGEDALTETEKTFIQNNTSVDIYSVFSKNRMTLDDDFVLGDFGYYQYLSIGVDGIYHNNTAGTQTDGGPKNICLDEDTFYRIDDGVEHIYINPVYTGLPSYVKPNGYGGTAYIRFYDKDLNCLGSGGISESRTISVDVTASGNPNLSTDAKYFKLGTSELHIQENLGGGFQIDSPNNWLVNGARIGRFNRQAKDASIDPDCILSTITEWRAESDACSVIPDIPIIAGHDYLVTVEPESEILNDDTKSLTVGVGYNGTIFQYIYSQMLLVNKFSFVKHATTSHPQSRVYVGLGQNPTTAGNAGVKIKASICDLTQPESLRRHIPEITNDLSAVIKRQGASNSYDSMLAIVHVTDVHGDELRHSNAVVLADRLVNAGMSVAFVNTGDSVPYYGTDGVSFMTEPSYRFPYLHTIGNHDVRNLESEADVYNKFIAPFATAGSYQVDNTNTYYYVDNSTYKIRFISINQFEKFDGTWDYYMSEDQLDWLCNTLVGTPQDYGIIILAHSPIRNILRLDSSYSEFYQNDASGWANWADTNLVALVDAFISGTSYQGTIYNYSVTADFSSKNSGVEFIAWIHGHEHMDRIGVYQGTTNLQLAVTNTCTNCWLDMSNRFLYNKTVYPYYNELSDTNRVPFTDSENAINVYCIDRENKTLRIARVGATLTNSLTDRRKMIIPYSIS